MIDKDIIELLEHETAKINSPDFIDSDPVQFPRRYEDLRDIEITALLVSSIAWGNRKMILRDAERMLALMEGQPYKYVMEKGYLELPDNQNIHRTFFTRNLKHFLAGLQLVYSRYGSIDNMVSETGIGKSETAAWELATTLNSIFAEANGNIADGRCLPVNVENSALKRLNMALRWLVRDDGIVDLGVWKSLCPSQLYIPLDVHVGNISRDLGLLARKSNDRKAVVELTDVLRQIRPDDPTIFDFALFGIGVSGRRSCL